VPWSSLLQRKQLDGDSNVLSSNLWFPARGPFLSPMSSLTHHPHPIIPHTSPSSHHPSHITLIPSSLTHHSISSYQAIHQLMRTIQSHTNTLHHHIITTLLHYYKPLHHHITTTNHYIITSLLQTITSSHHLSFPPLAWSLL
jgi:hypothetical protein